QARESDSPAKGRRALELLAELLKIDPLNSSALRLKEKIELYYAKNFTNTIEMKFIRIEPGEFQMGSPVNNEVHQANETPHKIKLTHPFLLATYPVTQAQWKAV